MKNLLLLLLMVFAGVVPDQGRAQVEEVSWLYRGYTGHEHLREFGIIHMNGRLYDPVLGRMLSPDNYIQAAFVGWATFGSQGYNRYSYAVNNPLRFTDPEGEWVHIVAGALIGGVINLATNWNNIDNFWEGAAAFGVGAGAGALTAATGGIGGAVLGGVATGATNGIIAQTGNGRGLNQVNWGVVGGQAVFGGIAGGVGFGLGQAGGQLAGKLGLGGNSIVSNAIQGAASGAGSGAVLGFSNGLFSGEGLDEAVRQGVRGGVIGLASGALIGGISGAVQTRLYNRRNPPVNYWIGRDVAPGRSPWAFKNTPHPRSGYILRSFQAKDGSTNTFAAWSLEKTEGGVKTYEIWGSTYHDAWDIITSGQGINLNTINKATFNTLTGYRVQFYFQSSPSSGSLPTLSFQRPDGKAYLKLRFR